MGDADAIAVRIEPGMSGIDPVQWDACATRPGGRVPENPFLSHAFLRTLEDAGCVGGRSGWLAQHLVIDGPDGRIAACMPCYVKSHSQGEYVFDHGWADAYERAGGRYYPKLQVAVPFTPVPGPRLLVRPDLDRDLYRAILLKGAIALAERYQTSSLHLTFLLKDDWEFLGQQGLLQRIDQQFHWSNDGYETFDDFLSALSSRKRKVIRRERRAALESGISIEQLTGARISDAHWDAFHDFYMDTGSRKWGRPYLNRTFFSLLGERMADRVLLIMAKRDEDYIAGALNLIGTDALYGRHWGCIEDHPFLHFEVCYYQAIDYAITHKLARVEAGAQGAHKLARGYVPTTTYSAHWIADAGFRRAVADYLEHERAHVCAEAEILGTHVPFRKDGQGLDSDG